MAVIYPPVFRYISPGLLDIMRREYDRSFIHTYTRYPRTPPMVTDPPTPLTDDDWGLPNYQFAPIQIDNIPCFYLEQEVPVVTPTGLITINTPYLTIRFDDQLEEGDRVGNIKTLSGASLLEGPVLVEQFTPMGTDSGDAVYGQAQLRRVKNLPSS